MQKGDEDKKRSLGGELVIPLTAIVFTLYYFSTIVDSPWTAQVSAFFIGAVLILLISIFLFRTLKAWKAGEVGLGLDALLEPRSFITKRLALLALTLGFIVFVDWGGFTITTFLFLGLATLLLSGASRWRLILGLSAGLAIGGYLLFILAFDTRFPDGPFEQMMQPLDAMIERGF